MKFLSILLPIAALAQSQSNWVLYEDFATYRDNNNAGDTLGNPSGKLWQLLEDCGVGANENQSITVTGGVLQITIGALQSGGTCGIYFREESHEYDYAAGYWMQKYMKTGYNWPAVASGWTDSFTHMRFKFRCGVALPRESGDYPLNVGVYIRNHNGPGGSSVQGQHYYHYLNPASYANTWLYVELNPTVQHQVGDGGIPDYPSDPEYPSPGYSTGYTGENVHYWTGMTRFYVTWQRAVELHNTTCEFDDVYFKAKDRDPYSWIASHTLTHNGTNWESTWWGPRFGSVTYNVRYSTAGSLKVAGFSTGTDGGQKTTGGGGFPTTIFNTSTISAGTPVWIAVRPIMPVSAASGTPIQLTLNSIQHNLTTGDQVSVASVCANANGTRTVTVVDVQKITLDGTSGACSYGGSGGTMTTTSDTSGFAEVFSGDPSAGGASSSGSSMTGKVVKTGNTTVKKN